MPKEHLHHSLSTKNQLLEREYDIL
uniref:Uncharacterized protein n=1 Tax=Arundo donax TaxID=35708 RepID=A0A0A9GVE5_ARUDO